MPAAGYTAVPGGASGSGSASTNPESLSSIDNITKMAMVMLVFLVFGFALLLGRSSTTKSSSNIAQRTDLARQRYQTCEVERRILNGEKEAEKDVDYDLQMATDDHEALMEENRLLNEDNDMIREDNRILERQVDDLREELDYKDFVTDDEMMGLEETMAVGNNTAELVELVEDYKMEGAITKDQLIETLVAELKKKRTILRQCRDQKGIPNPPTGL